MFQILLFLITENNSCKNITYFYKQTKVDIKIWGPTSQY